MHVEAEKGTFVFGFFCKKWCRPVPVWHMLCVHPVANFIPEAGLQNLGLVQNDLYYCQTKNRLIAYSANQKCIVKKQHNTELGLHGLNIKQPAVPKGKISVSALALS